LLAACQAELPTSADIDRMDAAGAERALTKLALTKDSSGPTEYVVDGVPMSVTAAKSIAADAIESINVTKAATGKTTRIAIGTKAGLGRTAAASNVVGVALTENTLVRRGDTLGFKVLQLPAKPGAEPLILIDGVVADNAALKTIDRERIEAVEVIKGPAAMREHPQPAAANGVILIKL
jgi:outer membrane receptor protein involved in Fe transport